MPGAKGQGSCGERLFGGRACVNGRSIEQRDLCVLSADQKRYLRAPKNDGLCALGYKICHDSSILATRIVFDKAKAQFFVNDAVNSLAVSQTRNDYSKAVAFAQSVAIEGLFHRELRTQETNDGVAGALDLGGRWISDVKQRN